MSVNDGFLRAVPSDTDVDDGRLYDPTVADAAVPSTPVTVIWHPSRTRRRMMARAAALAAGFALILTGCVDLNFTVRAPCSASVTQSRTGDTLYKLAVDSVACPR